MQMLTEACGEASRSGDLIRLAAFEGTHRAGQRHSLQHGRPW